MRELEGPVHTRIDLLIINLMSWVYGGQILGPQQPWFSGTNFDNWAAPAVLLVRLLCVISFGIDAFLSSESWILLTCRSQTFLKEVPVLCDFYFSIRGSKRRWECPAYPGRLWWLWCPGVQTARPIQSPALYYFQVRGLWAYQF